MPTPKLSVVIPVYNEEAVLPTLFARLYPALDALQISYEIVYVNDGSKDKSVALLRQQFQSRPHETRVVLFHANFGQHSAVMAGLAYARGEYVVTMDADLQNPPEENIDIHDAVERVDGHQQAVIHAGDAGVVEGDVQALVLPANAGEQRFHLRFIGNVGFEVAITLKRPIGRLAAAADDMVSGSDELFRDVAADSSARAGNQGDRAFAHGQARGCSAATARM